MKKLLIVLSLVGLLASFSPAAQAEITPQMLQSAQQSPELKAQLIQLITQMIVMLQEQLNIVIAQEAAINSLNSTAQQQSQAINQIQSNTQQIVQNTTPVPPPAPQPTPIPAVSPTPTPIVQTPVTPAPTCTLAAEWVRKINEDGSNPDVPTISWTSVGATKGIITNSYSIGYSWDIIKDLKDLLSEGSYTNFAGSGHGDNFKATFTGPGGITTCSAYLSARPVWIP